MPVKLAVSTGLLDLLKDGWGMAWGGPGWRGVWKGGHTGSAEKTGMEL